MSGAPNRRREVYSTGQAARVLGYPQQTLINMCNRGEIRCYRVPGAGPNRFRRITHDEIERVAKLNGVELKFSEGD